MPQIAIDVWNFIVTHKALDYAVVTSAASIGYKFADENSYLHKGLQALAGAGIDLPKIVSYARSIIAQLGSKKA